MRVQEKLHHESITLVEFSSQNAAVLDSKILFMGGVDGWVAQGKLKKVVP
jgi:hypothetical protein